MKLPGEVRVDLRPVASLLPHEETIPEQLDKIASQIRREGIQKDPLIVDRESGAVLDGMHRLAAFGKMGIQNIVCCLVDYSSPGIELRRWARVYRPANPGLVAQALEDVGLSRKASMAEAFGALDSRKCGVAVIGSAGCKLGDSGLSLGGAFRIARSLDEAGKMMRWQRSFVGEDEIDIALQDESNFVLMFQRLTKSDVLEAARTGRLFPCKTSMHYIDPRPVALDFPIAELDSADSKSIDAFMEKRSPQFLPHDSEYEGRRYKERLLVLDRR